MAETKKTTSAKKSTSTKSTATKSTAKTQSSKPAQSSSSSASGSSNSSKRKSGGIRTWGLNKISFWVVGAIAILYLIASILSLCGASFKAVSVMQGVATAFAICIVAYLAWRYVKPKQMVWKVLWFVFLLVVLLGIVIPLVK